MDYTVNIRTIEKLIEIEKQIYKALELLVIYHDPSEGKYCPEVCEELKMYLQKENKLLSQIPHKASIINYFYNLVGMNEMNFFDSEKEAENVLNRFYLLFTDLERLYEDEEQQEYFEDDEYDYLFQAKNLIALVDNLKVEFIGYLEKLKPVLANNKVLALNAQYLTMYDYKSISELFVANNFNLKELKPLSDAELIKKTTIKSQEFSNLKQNVIYGIVESLFLDLCEELSEDREIHDLRLWMGIENYKFLITKLDTLKLFAFRNSVREQMMDLKEPSAWIEHLYRILNRELSRRDNVPDDDIEPNKSRAKIDDVSANTLIELFKLEEILLEVFDELDFYDIGNNQKIEELSNLIAIEKELVSQITINNKNSSVIASIITEDLENFFDDENNLRKKVLITERLYHLLPYFRKSKMSPSQTEGSYEIIYSNHIIDSLKMIRNVIFSVNDEEKRRAASNLYIGTFFTQPFLTDDLVITKGNHLMIDRFSDELSAQATGISDLEYSYDKDEQLYELYQILAEEILKIGDRWTNDPHFWAMFQFKLSEINDIMYNVSDEHLFELYDIIDEDGTYKHTQKTKKMVFKKWKKAISKRGY